MKEPTPEYIENEAIKRYAGWATEVEKPNQVDAVDVWTQAFYEGALWAAQYWQQAIKEDEMNNKSDRIPDGYTDVRDLSTEELLNFYLDWDEAMANSFNGKEFSREFPRNTIEGPLCLGNKHLTFYDFKGYCKEQNII